MLLVPYRTSYPSYLVYHIAARDLIECVYYNASLAGYTALAPLSISYTAIATVTPRYLACLAIDRLATIEVLR